MAIYGKDSMTALNTAHPDLITLFQEVVKLFDNTIVFGYRSLELQFTLFKKGRIFVRGKWVIEDKKAIVTYKDGIIKKSEHNYSPSHAIDAIPYPVDWTDTRRMYYFAGFVICTAKRLKVEGKITHDICWLGDQDMDTEVKDQTFFDLAHFEIVE